MLPRLPNHPHGPPIRPLNVPPDAMTAECIHSVTVGDWTAGVLCPGVACAERWAPVEGSQEGESPVCGDDSAVPPGAKHSRPGTRVHVFVNPTTYLSLVG